jgi:WD40 repeat protein
VRLLDVKTGKEVGKLDGHTDFVTGLAFAGDGNTFLSTSTDGTLRFWDLVQQKEIHQASNRGGILLASPDGRLVASAPGDAEEVHFWDPATRKKVGSIEETGTFVKCMAFSPDGKRLVTAGYSQTVHIWDVTTGKELLPFPGHQAAVVSLAFAPDGSTLASRSFDQTVRLWDVASHKEVQQWRLADGRGIHAVDHNGWWQEGCSVAFAPSGKLLAAVGGKGTKKIHLWELPSGQSRFVFADPSPYGRDPPGSVAFSPDGEFLVAATSDVTRVWSATSGEERAVIDTQDPAPGRRQVNVEVATFSPNGFALAVGCSGMPGTGGIRLWNWPDLSERWHLKTPHASFLAFSPDSQLLASGYGDSMPGVWLTEVRTGAIVRKIDADRHGATAMAFSPDGRLLATGGYKDHTVRVWDVLTGEQLDQFDGHSGMVCSVAFSPDGKLLASGSADTTILLWDVSGIRARVPPAELDAEDINRLWAKLAGDDAGRAYGAILNLAGAGDQAAAFLKEHLKPVPKPDAQRAAKLLTDLEADDFTVRQLAAAELKRLGRAVEPDLRRRLADKPTPDLRKQLEELLAALTKVPFDGEQIRALRSLLVLERIGTPAARAILKDLAGGAEAADLTRGAKGALERLDRFPVDR